MKGEGKVEGMVVMEIERGVKRRHTNGRMGA